MKDIALHQLSPLASAVNSSPSSLMKRRCLRPLGIFVLVLPAMAVYAPIPEQEQGKLLSASVGASIYHDSNLFAARTGPISTFVHELTPSLVLNTSVTDQTFLSASYKLTLDYFDDRPGQKLIFSHDFDARLAHSFAPGTTVDFNDDYQIQGNPQSLLAGVPVNTDQSFKRNQFDARSTLALSERTSVAVKARLIDYSYNNAVLASTIDHSENLVGFEGSFEVRPQIKLNADYRYQTVDYRNDGAANNKHSNFFLGGLDYTATRKLTLTLTAGVEERQRDGAGNVTAPSVELSAKYDYAQGSYVSAGYGYDLEETSNVALYTDEKVNRFFVNVQHALGGSLTASASVDIEPSQLQGRAGVSPDRSETTDRLGLGLTWLGAKNWSVSTTFDYDRVSSSDVSREYVRNRVGLNARYSY